MKVCLQNILLLLELILRHGGPAATLVAAVIGSGAIIFEARSGRAHTLTTMSSFNSLWADFLELCTTLQRRLSYLLLHVYIRLDRWKSPYREKQKGFCIGARLHVGVSSCPERSEAFEI